MASLRYSIALRIYTIIGLSFCGLIGLAMTQAETLATALKEQRQNELGHLVQTAVEPVSGAEVIWYRGPCVGLSH